MRKTDDPDMVLASEIGSYAFCPEAWRLGSELGLRPNNERQLARGEEIHARTAVLEERSQSALRLGLVLLALGVIVLGLCLYILAVGR